MSEQNPEVEPIEIKKAPAPKKKKAVVAPTEDVGEAEALPLNEETIVEVAKPVKKAAPKKAKKADEITSTGAETRATVPVGNDLPDATEVATIEAKPVKKVAPKKAKKAEEPVVPTTDDAETGELPAPAPVAEVPKAKKTPATKKAPLEGEGTPVDIALASDEANASEPPQAVVAPKKKKAVVKAEPTNTAATDPSAAEASNPEQTTEVAEPETTSKAPPKATKKKAPSKASVVENEAPVGSESTSDAIETPEVELTEQSKPKKKAAPKPKQVENEEEATSAVNVVNEASACGKEEIRPPSTNEQPAAAAVPTKKTVPPKKKMAPIKDSEATEVTTTSANIVSQEETPTVPPGGSIGEAAREESMPPKDITSTEAKVAPTKSTPPAAVAAKKAATPIGSSQGSKGPSAVVSRSSSNTNAAKRNGVVSKPPAAVVIQATSQPTTRSASSTNNPQHQDRSQSKSKIADKSPGPSPAPNQRRTSSNQPPPAWKTAALASFAVPAPSQGKREKKPQQTKEEKLALHEQRMADIEDRERKRRAVVKAQLAKIEENIGDFVLKAREQKENEREKQAQIRKDRMEERRIQRDEEKLRLAAGNLHPLAAMLAATAITAAVNTSIEGAVVSDSAAVEEGTNLRSEPSASPARPVVQLSMADIIPDSQYKPIIAAFENQQASKQRLDRAQKIEVDREREERERVGKELAARKAKMNASRFVPLPRKIQQQHVDNGDSPQDDKANQLPAGSEERSKTDKPQGTSPTAKLFVAPLDPSAASLNIQEDDHLSNVSTPRTEDMNETDRAAIYGAIAVVKKEVAGTDRQTHQVTGQPAEEKIDIAAHTNNEDAAEEEQRKAEKDEAKKARKLAKRNEKRRLKFEAKRAQRLVELEEKRQARRMERRTQKKDDKIQFRRQLKANRKAEAAAAIVDSETPKSTTPTPPPLAITPRGAERLQEATEHQQLESQAQQQPSTTEYIVSARTAEAVDAITECVSDAVEHVVQLAEPTVDGEEPNLSSPGMERGEGSKQPVVSGSLHTTPEHGPSTSVSDGPVSPGTHQRLHAVASETTAAALSQAIFSQEEQRRKSLAADHAQTSAKSSRSSSVVSSVSSSPSSSVNSHSRSHSISDASSASSSDFSLSPDDSIRASHKQARTNGEILATTTAITTKADVAPSDIDGSSSPPAFDEEAALRIRINEWKAAEKARRLNVKLKAHGKKHQKEERKRRLKNLVAGSPTKQNGVRPDAKEESHFQTLEEIRERYLLEMKANTREFQVQQGNHRRHQMQEYGKQAEESNFAAAEGSQNPELLATSTLAEDGSRRRDHSKVRKQRDILAEALKRHEPMALQAPAMAENVVSKSAPPAEEELAKQKKIVAVGNQYMREAKLKAKAKSGDDPSAGPISAAQQQQLEKDQQVEQQRKQTKALGNNYLRQLKHDREGRGGEREGGDNSEPTASRAMFVPRRRLDDSSPSSSPMPADRQQQKQEALEKARKEVLALNRKMLLAPLAPLPHQVASGNSPNALAASAPTGSLLGTNSPFPPKRGAAGGGPSTVNGRLPPMLGASMPLGNGESKADPIVEAINAKMRLLKMLGSPTKHGGNAETALGPARPNRNLKPLAGK